MACEYNSVYIKISVAPLSILSQLFTQHFNLWQLTIFRCVAHDILNNEAQRFLNNDWNK